MNFNNVQFGNNYDEVDSLIIVLFLYDCYVDLRDISGTGHARKKYESVRTSDQMKPFTLANESDSIKVSDSDYVDNDN